MIPLLVPLRASSEHILIVRALRTSRAEVHGPDCVLDLFQLYD